MDDPKTTTRASQLYGGRDETFERMISTFMHSIAAEVAALRDSRPPDSARDDAHAAVGKPRRRNLLIGTPANASE